MADGSWSIAEAKAKLSEIVDKAGSDGPQTITRNGRNAALVVSHVAWEARGRPRRSLNEILLDRSYGVLEREEVDTLFARDNGPERPISDS